VRRRIAAGGKSCPTRKTRYRDRASAAVIVRRMQRTSGRQAVPVRYYECPLCNGWHLTSKED
jgi:hypothetical protein